jgi:serine/threonine protein kinase
MKSIAGIDPASKITLSLLPAVPHNPVTSAISNGGYYVAAGSDNFTNQTIMHLILGAVLGDCPHYVYQYDAFICDTVGVNIMEVANRGDLYRYLTQLATTKERLDACGECLRQILPVLMLLKRLGFMHNDLKLKNIFVHQPEPAGPVIYLLADFDKSAISWKTVRFYNNNNGLDLVSSTVALAVEYHKYGADQLKPGLIAGFSGMKLAGQSLAPYIMHNAAGYYLGYDIYTLVFSMLCYPGLFLAVESDHNSPMYRIFRALSRIDQAKSGTQKSGVYEDRPELRDALQKAIHQQKTNPEALQSISIINAYLHDGRVFIRNDLRALLAELGLDVYHTAEEKVLAVALDRSHKPILSKNGHLCLTAPAQKSCRTIPYRSWGLLYETDQVAGGGGRRRKN